MTKTAPLAFSRLVFSSLVLFGLALVAGCGGGGGNPGICTGSAEVCAGSTPGDATGVSATPSTPSTGSTTTTVPDTAVCSQFASQAAAQQYFFEHGATQLDPDNDGVACNN